MWIFPGRQSSRAANVFFGHKAHNLQRVPDIGVGSIVLRCIDEADAAPQGVANDCRTFFKRKIQLSGTDRQRADADAADRKTGLSEHACLGPSFC